MNNQMFLLQRIITYPEKIHQKHFNNNRPYALNVSTQMINIKDTKEPIRIKIDRWAERLFKTQCSLCVKPPIPIPNPIISSMSHIP